MERLLCSVCGDDRCIQNNIYVESLYIAPDNIFQELITQQGGLQCDQHKSILLIIPPSLGQILKYNRQQLQGSFQIMGCKVTDAKAATTRLFEQVMGKLRRPEKPMGKDSGRQVRTVTIAQSFFQQCAKRALGSTGFEAADHILNFNIACEIESQKRSITVLLGGASGTGKSTLASLIASRLGISTVLSTDSIRHILRSLIPIEENPILFASTYETYKFVTTQGLSVKQACLIGYQRQCDCVFEHLRAVIEDYHNRKESIVIEGVHLSVDVLKKLMKSFPSCLPFVIIIKDKGKHKERFAVRSKYMTLDPKVNKYIAYFGNIRAIQKKFIAKADEVLIPKIDNSNVDRSFGLIHATIVKCLRKISEGTELYDRTNKRCILLHEEFTLVSKSAWSSKEAQEMINARANKGELFKRFFKATIPDSSPEPPQKSALSESSDPSGEAPEVGSLLSGSLDVDLLLPRVELQKRVVMDDTIKSQHSDEEWPSDGSCRAASPGSYSSEGSAHSTHEEGQLPYDPSEPRPRHHDDSELPKHGSSAQRSKSAPRYPAPDSSAI